jgi:hypothetical protein
MILGYIHMVHYLPVTIKVTDDRWKMELDFVPYQSTAKNRETK